MSEDNLESARSFMRSLMIKLKEDSGSDLFITAGACPSIRIDGKIQPASKKRLSPTQTRSLVESMMSDEEREQFLETNECNFAVAIEDVARYRVSAFIQRGSAGMVIRVISNYIPTFESLGLPEVLEDLAMTKRGLIIFVGGTGTGKSTSLASLVDFRNRNSNGHIITIEDPVEFVHQHKGCIITQREVGTDTESYWAALKNTLRQAPDVILIGEIRDRETMEYAMQFAETGHLCLATLHANNANQAMERIISFFPEERHSQLYLDLSLNLKSMISQRLIPKPSGKGRVVAVEVLINTPLMQDLIQEAKIHEMKELMERSREYGMQTFDQALFKLVREGRITFEEALRNADSINNLRLALKLADDDESGIKKDDPSATMFEIEGDNEQDSGHSLAR